MLRRHPLFTTRPRRDNRRRARVMARQYARAAVDVVRLLGAHRVLAALGRE
jgi:hypothetical protein